MLREHSNVRQEPGAGLKRWFYDDEFELIVWMSAQGSLTSFQLYYRRDGKENAITWNGGTQCVINAVDTGGTRPEANRSPVLAAGGLAPDVGTYHKLKVALESIDRGIAEVVLKVLKPHVDTSARASSGKDGPPAGAGAGAGGGRTTAPLSSAPGPAAPKAFPTSMPPSAKPVTVKVQPRTTSSAVMLPEELMKKVRRLEITTRRAVDDLMSGQYRSHFKGHGVQFSEHRVYTPGDDVRHMDWKVSARTREPLIKKFEEERELTVMLIVDVSASERFGSSGKLKSEVAAEIGGMLAYAATHTGDKVGVLLFAGDVEHIIPPKKGRQHVMRIIRDLLGFQARTKGTNLAAALEAASRVMKHSGVVFVLSDFLGEEYDIQLKRLARRHDVVAIWISDEREESVPEAGLVFFEDPETGAEIPVDTGSYAFREWIKGFRTEHETDTLSAFKAGKVEQLKVLTKEDYGEAVIRFFRARGRGAGRVAR